MECRFTDHVLVFVACLILACSYDLCPDIQQNGYKYVLSELANANILALYQNSIVQISPCKAFTCQQAQTQYLTYIGKRTSSSCKPFSSKTSPLKQYYSMIDADNPQKGLSIKFPPLLDNDTLFGSTLQILCARTAQVDDPNVQLKTSCTEVEELESGRVKMVMKCEIYSEVGCPSIASNHFWEFLYQSSIIFAITMWIIALFILFMGYLAIRGTIWIFGVFSGVLFSLILAAQNYVNFITENQGIFIFLICLSFFLGIVLGIALLTIPKLGYANIGIWVAAIFSLLLQNSVYYLTGSNLALYITFGVVSLIMIIISLLELKYYIILCSSFVGGFWAIRPLGFFLPYYPNQLSASRYFQISVETPWQFYLYLVSIIILTVLGAAFQFCLFKKTHGKYHGKNEAYYLEREGDIKEKLKKIFQFKQVKKLLKNGRDEVVELRNLIFDKSQKSQTEMKTQQLQQQQINKGYVQMSDLGHNQARNKKYHQQMAEIKDSSSEESDRRRNKRGQNKM